MNLGPTELLLMAIVATAPVLFFLAVYRLTTRFTRVGVAQRTALTTSCPDCGGVVSTIARSCPHCGRPGSQARERKPLNALGWMLLLIVWTLLTVALMYAMPAYAFLLAVISIFAFVAWTRGRRVARQRLTFE